jgi:NodT family efflux transporter outer membrane factor (OMF) lipoprotein
MNRKWISWLCGGLRALVWLLSASLLSSCVSPSLLPNKAQPVAADWANRGHIKNAPGIDPASWWKNFNDPVLDTLVTLTLAQNLSLEQAGYRLQASRALVRTALAQRLPQIGATASARRQQRLSGADSFDHDRNGLLSDGTSLPREESRVSGYYELGFDASWEIDLFGRVAASGDAARSAANIALADTRIAKVSVVAEVVRNYIELRGLQRRQALFAENVADQNRLLALTRERLTAGIASDFDVDQRSASVVEMTAQLPLVEQAIQQATQRIAVLTGRSTVDVRLLDSASQPSAEHLAIKLLPADLMRVRPEIQRAEHAVAQASAELGIATADLYPRFTLMGDLIANGNLIGIPLPRSTSNVSTALSISIPLLDWGARRAIINAREAALAEAIAGYRLAVLEGVEETENALNAIETSRRRASENLIRFRSAQRSKANTNALYERGVVSMADLLEASITLRQAQINSAETFEQQAIAAVALHKAIGGASLAPAYLAIR